MNHRVEALVLSCGGFASQGTIGNVWSFLSLLSVGGVSLASLQMRGERWGETRDAVKHLEIHRTGPHNNVSAWSEMSVLLRWRKPVLGQEKNDFFLSFHFQHRCPHFTDGETESQRC